MTVETDITTVRLAIAVGIAASMLWYERRNMSPGGVIVPGLIALFLFTRPLLILTSMLVALLTVLAVRWLSRRVILFGRRRFAAVMLVSFGVAWAIEAATAQVYPLHALFQVIGFIIPGLIANEMERQGVFQTLSTLSLISLVTALVVWLFVGWR